MGSSMRAHLAYGVNVGGEEDPKVGPKDESGWLTDEWERAHRVGAWDPDGPDGDEDGRDLGVVLEEAITIASGFTLPEPSFMLPGHASSADDWRVHVNPEHDVWSTHKRDALEAFGVSLDTSGRDGSVGYLLVITSTLTTVEWNEAHDVNPRVLEGLARDRGESWNSRLCKVLAAAGLHLEDGNAPGWIMYASYG